MQFLLYLSAISSGLLAIVIWMLRNWLLTRLKNAIKYEYNTQLEELKSDLKLKETEIDALRRGALNGLSDQQKILYKQRVKAAIELWENVLILAPAKQISSMLSALNYEEALKLTNTDPQVKEIFKMMDQNTDVAYWKNNNAFKTRLFLSELSWALFHAYSSILSIYYIRMQALKIGLDKDFTKNASILDLVKKTLPHHENYINEYGISGLHYLLDELEGSILHELKRVLEGKEADKEALARAAAIIENTESLSQQK